MGNMKAEKKKYMPVYFGRRITVPESHIREFEEGVLKPLTGEFTTRDNKIIHYWYKDIHSVVVHMVTVSIEIHGKSNHNIMKHGK